MGCRLTGEDVKLALASTDASGGVPLVIADSNGVDRPLQSYERLVIDALNCDVSTDAGAVTITDPGADVSADATLLGSFSPSIGEFHVQGEGVNVSIGSTPVVTAATAGAVAVVGAGRVINAKSQGFQAGYKSLLTPGGNVSGQ